METKSGDKDEKAIVGKKVGRCTLLGNSSAYVSEEDIRIFAPPFLSS